MRRLTSFGIIVMKPFFTHFCCMLSNCVVTNLQNKFSIRFFFVADSCIFGEVEKLVVIHNTASVILVILIDSL